MIDRETLKALGWSDELIRLAVEIATKVPAHDSMPGAAIEAVELGEAVGTSRVSPDGPPVGTTILRADRR